VNAAMTNEEMEPVIERKIDESITAAFEVLRKRIDKFGVTQPNIQRLGKSARILVELPGAKDVGRVTKLVTSTAQLEFWDVYKFDDMSAFLQQANNKLKELIQPEVKEEVVTDSTDIADNEINDLLDGEDATDSLSGGSQEDPIFSKIASFGYQGGPILGNFRVKDMATIDGYLAMPQILHGVYQKWMKT
jgi:SecD/SecF fusion protein